MNDTEILRWLCSNDVEFFQIKGKSQVILALYEEGNYGVFIGKDIIDCVKQAQEAENGMD